MSRKDTCSKTLQYTSFASYFELTRSLLFSRYRFGLLNVSLCFQVLLVRDELPSRGQLPKQSLYKGQWETFPSASKCFLLLQKSTSVLPIKTLTKHCILAGLCTTTKKRCGTEETGKTSQHHLSGPPLLRRTQSDFSDMGT